MNNMKKVYNMQHYELIDIVQSQHVMYAYDVTIRNNATNECVVCDQIKIFDRIDEYFLGYLFQCVKKGTYNDECMLNDDDAIELQKELNINDIDEYDELHENSNNEFSEKLYTMNFDEFRNEFFSK